MTTPELRVVQADARHLPLPDNTAFWARVDQSGDCWLWTGGINGKGYGSLRFRGLSTFAHRVAYELEVGPIPARYVIDHLCRVRACCRPAHLEAVTNGENLRRGDVRENNRNLAKTECPRQHPYDDLNTYVDRTGRRHCRTCRRADVARRRAAMRKAAA